MIIKPLSIEDYGAVTNRWGFVEACEPIDFFTVYLPCWERGAGRDLCQIIGIHFIKTFKEEFRGSGI